MNARLSVPKNTAMGLQNVMEGGRVGYTISYDYGGGHCDRGGYS